MNVALAYHKGDRDQAVRWMEWVRDLGGIGSHQLFTICAFDCEPIEGILPSTMIPDSERVPGGEWSASSAARSAAAPNAMLRTFAWHFHLQKLGPWAFIEPDCIPLKPGWIDSLEQEYLLAGKPFMGARVLIPNVPEHLTGNSLMPENVPELAPSLIMRTNWITEGKEYELAFDIAGAKEVLPQSHFSVLIQHKFRHPGFKTREEFEATIDPRAVVFHSCKDGSIYPFLRKTDTDEGFVQAAGAAAARIVAEEQVNREWGGTPEQVVEGFRKLAEPRTESSTTAPVTGHLNGDSRESLVRDTVAILKQLCTAPRYIAQVRRELKAQGVTR